MTFIGSVSRHVRYSGQFAFDHTFADFYNRRFNVDIDAQQLYSRGMPQLYHNYRGTKKYDRAQPIIHFVDWETSFLWAVKHWQPYVGESVKLPFVNVIQALNKQASPGPPWTRRYTDKSHALNDDDVLKQIAHSDLNLHNTPLFCLWNGNTKEEVRLKTKIAQGSLRVFTGADVVFSVTCDRVCRQMNEKFYASVFHTWNCVGITKYFRGWDHLYRKLDVHPNAFELDES